MKTIKNFQENQLVKNELVHVNGGATIERRNPNGSITYIEFNDTNGNGRLDAGEKVISRITIGPIILQ